MQLTRTWTVALVLALAAGVAALVISCSTAGTRQVAPPLDIPGAHYVGNQVCFECHTNIVREFQAGPHARLRLAGVSLPDTVGCESCHGPGSKHVQVGGGRGQFIINPGNNPEACFRCHLQVRAEFELPVHHPVIEGHMNCVECHDPHGGDIYQPAGLWGDKAASAANPGGLAMARRNESCAQCHREQTRPFAFEHPALREGCVACHSPHGSVNRMMLVQADGNLCLRCHTQMQTASGEFYIGNVPHAANLRIGACWSCHTAVHGSDIDPRLRY